MTVPSDESSELIAKFSDKIDAEYAQCCAAYRRLDKDVPDCDVYLDAKELVSNIDVRLKEVLELSGKIKDQSGLNDIYLDAVQTSLSIVKASIIKSLCVRG